MTKPSTNKNSYRKRYPKKSKYDNKRAKYKPVVVARFSACEITFSKNHTKHTFSYKLPDVSLKDYYVYCVIFNGELLYIGKGSKDRYKHTTSKDTHNLILKSKYELCCRPNSGFTEAHYKVLILFDDLTNKEAYRKEARLINLFKPMANIDGNKAYTTGKYGRLRLINVMAKHANLANSTDVETRSKRSLSKVKRLAKKRSQKSYQNKIDKELDESMINDLRGGFFFPST